MTLKKLAAGAGYEYLTRQVAAADSTELGSMPLADYYEAKGEAPGRWVGSGLVGVERLACGDVVTAGQMQHLFGDGCHPVTGTALGRPFKQGSVAGFDLTFSAVKSVSTLWAVAPPDVAAEIRRAHDAAVADALRFLESHGLFTREGTGGARQVDTRGLIAAAFVHRDSRSGDPDLHTHVAVANKVQTVEGKWLSIYGTVLHQHVVAASETYNTALEFHLRERLGVAFVDVDAGRGRRPVREIAGVSMSLRNLWSTRSRDIDARVAVLREEFVAQHGRLPTTKEGTALAQRANLETREAKHEPRSEAEQRATWRAQADDHMNKRAVDLMVYRALHPPEAAGEQVSTAWLSNAADGVIAELESRQATWQSWHLYAEAQRQIRGLNVHPDQVADVVDQLVDTATGRLINLTPNRDPITEPPALTRKGGTSVYRHSGADHFTSQGILDAEQRIVDAAGQSTSSSPDPIDVELALMKRELDGTRLNPGQHELVRSIAADPRRVVLALAPAGSGKTTALRALHAVYADLGYETFGLAPSAAAAAVLRDATGMQTETLAKLDHLIGADQDLGFGSHTVVIIDEAGMADTLTLDRVIATCTNAGAKVCLIGDDQQLAAVGAGGVLRDIATTHGAVRLDEVVRFNDPAEAAASVDLRAGDRAALGFYLDHDRMHAGDTDTCLTEVLTAWASEQAHGRECLMLAPTRDLVARLNRAARADRLGGTRPKVNVDLADGNQASPGDSILTRHNDRRLGVSGTDWVKNGDRWTITALGANGTIHARHLRSGLHVTLPPEYVANYVELGYATTVHAAQGSTADVMHGIVTGTEDRQLLYTMLTRGRDENHVHVVIDEPADEQFLPGIDEQLTAMEILDRIVERDSAAISASTRLVHAASPATQLHEATERYADAVTVAAHRLLDEEADDALEAAGTGPLPWLPGIPAALRSRPSWSNYLDARTERIRTLVDSVRRDVHLPSSLRRLDDVLTDPLREAVVVWRAANGVSDDDEGLLGPRTGDLAADRYARHLQRQIDALYPEPVRRWEAQIAHAIGDPDHRDDHTLDLARELDRIQACGLNATQMLRRAATLRRPLPDERKVEALAYRIERIAANDAALQPQTHQPSRQSPGIGL